MYQRSRLQRLEEKRNVRKAALLVGLTIILILTALFAAIPVLIKVAGLLTDINSANRPVTRDDTIPPIPPILDLPYDATNSANLAVSGRAESGTTVVLVLNDIEEGSVVVDEAGHFLFETIELTEGDNTLVAVASDQAGNTSKPSSPTNLYFSKNPPQISIDTPSDHQSTSAREIEIKGQVTAGSRLTINDRTVIVNSEGKFATKFNLTGGDNPLVFQVIDKAGNKTRKEITVVSTQ